MFNMKFVTKKYTRIDKMRVQLITFRDIPWWCRSCKVVANMMFISTFVPLKIFYCFLKKVNQTLMWIVRKMPKRIFDHPWGCAILQYINQHIAKKSNFTIAIALCPITRRSDRKQNWIACIAAFFSQILRQQAQENFQNLEFRREILEFR